MVGSERAETVEQHAHVNPGISIRVGTRPVDHAQNVEATVQTKLATRSMVVKYGDFTQDRFHTHAACA